MKTNNFKPVFLLLFFIVVLACSSDETNNNSTTHLASRPSLPIIDNEVQIGTQIWMTKNLNVSRYRNGNLIPQVTDPTQWASLTTGAWCYYENNTANGPIYGKLYNAHAVNDLRGLAPHGYHVPSDFEWTILTNFLGGETVAGGKIKEVGTAHWMSPNNYATNSSGFNSLPAGDRDLFGASINIASHTYYWTSSENDSFNAWARSVKNNDRTILRFSNYKIFGFSVRCVKD